MVENFLSIIIIYGGVWAFFVFLWGMLHSGTANKDFAALCQQYPVIWPLLVVWLPIIMSVQYWRVTLQILQVLGAFAITAGISTGMVWIIQHHG